MRVAAADGGALEKLRANPLPADAFQHRHAELSGAFVAVGRQIRQVADAGELQLTIEHAEDRIAREIDRADVVFNDVVRHDLAEAQKAVVFVEREEVGQ
jgi:hypothetical protein